jgi:hypothetical protein
VSTRMRRSRVWPAAAIVVLVLAALLATYLLNILGSHGHK